MNGDSRNLDILRAVAVIAVLVDHTLMALGHNHLGPVNCNWIGRTGVMFFFVHTSLVLMFSLQRSRDTRSFYLRRAFRIYPLCIVAVMFAHFVYSPAPAISTRDFFLNLALVQNLFGAKNAFGELWSLPLEVQMYLVLPVLFWIASRRPKALIGVWVGAMAVMYIWHTWIFVPCFLAGVISFALTGRLPRVLPRWAWPPTVVAVLLVFACVPGWERCWWPCLLLGMLIPMFQEAKSSLFSAAASKIAKYSYGIYLTHPFVIRLSIVTLEAHPAWLQVVEYAVLTTALPVVFYHLVEHPGIVCGKKLASRVFGKTDEPLPKALAATAD